MCASLCVDIYIFLSFGLILSSGKGLGHVDDFPKWLHCFTSPSAGYKSLSCSTSLQTLGLVRLFDFSHSNGHVVVFSMAHSAVQRMSGPDGL